MRDGSIKILLKQTDANRKMKLEEKLWHEKIGDVGRSAEKIRGGQSIFVSAH
jgi:hypothetical protein